jgi:hypothetical protein
MADVFDDDIATAQELIDEFGQQCYWQKAAAVDPDAPAVPGYPVDAEPPDAIPCKIAFFSGRDLNRGTFEFLQQMGLSLEVPESGEVGLLAGGISFTPEMTDTLRRGSEDAAEISVDKIDRLAPNGTPVLYYITVTA